MAVVFFDYIFYLLHWLIAILLAGVLVGIISFSLGRGNDHQLGLRLGAGVSAVFCLTLSVLILIKKRLYHNGWCLLLGLLSGLLAYVGGALLGLIPTTYLASLAGNIGLAKS